jgi:hypothetical protein
MMMGMDEAENFLLCMQIATLDGESWLYQLPQGYSVVGSSLKYGPWPAASCATVLRIWYQADLIRLHFQDFPEWELVPSDWGTRLVDGDTLADADAWELLGHPERWVQGHTDGYVAPLRTWQGEVAPEEQWLTEALETARRLPLSEC